MSGPTPDAPVDHRDPTPSGRPGDAEAVDPLDLLIVLGRHRRSLWLWPLVAGALAAAVAFAIPKTYTGVTQMLPPQQAQSTAAAMLAQLGGLANVAGGALGMKTPSELYIRMLKSNAVADALIERFRLKELYDEKYLVDARKDLARDTQFLSDKSGVITVEVDAHDPRLAADLANAYVEQLHKLTSTLAVTEAAQRRLFFERQLQQTKEKLADAEVRLRQAIESGGLVSVDAQSRVAVETVARLRAQISAKEVQIRSMRGYAAAGNPDLQRAEQELSSLRQELSRIESGIGDADRPEAGEGLTRAGAPGMATIRLVREVKYQEVMFDLLAKQYEMARVDESKEAPIIQVMDRATPPERKSRPRRALITSLAAALGLLAAVLAAFARHALQGAHGDPLRQARIDSLRAAWRSRT